MKHTKNIARIVAFALLAATMIGTLTGCLSTSTGSSTETPAVVKTELSGVYVDAPYPEEGKESFGIALLDFEGTPGKVQCYWFSKSKGEDLFFNSRFMAPVDYEIYGNKIIFKDVVLSTYPEQGAKDYTGTYDGATDTVGMPNEFIGRGGKFTTLSFTTDNFFDLIAPLPTRHFADESWTNGDGDTVRLFIEHDADNKTMQFYSLIRKKDGEKIKLPRFGRMENDTWVASPASYEDTGKGILLFKNVWEIDSDVPADFEVKYGMYGELDCIYLPDISGGFGGYDIRLQATDKNYLDPTVSWE